MLEEGWPCPGLQQPDTVSTRDRESACWWVTRSRSENSALTVSPANWFHQPLTSIVSDACAFLFSARFLVAIAPGHQSAFRSFKNRFAGLECELRSGKNCN